MAAPRIWTNKKTALCLVLGLAFLPFCMEFLNAVGNTQWSQWWSSRDSTPVSYGINYCRRLTLALKDDFNAQRMDYKLLIMVHTSKATWETRGRAIKDTWMAEKLPAGVGVVW